MIFSLSRHVHTKTWHPYMPCGYSHPCHCQTQISGLSMSVGSFADMDSLPTVSPSITISTQSFLPAVVGALSNVLMAITSLAATIASTVIQLTVKFQDMGETLFAAFFILSFLQAAVAMYQYRYDVRGQLVFPDGPTIGVENAGDVSNANNKALLESNIIRKEYPAVNREDKRTKNKDEVQPDDIYGVQYFLRKLNKSLLLLLPWITSNIHNILTKNSHLFHIGFIITLVRFLEDTMLGKDDGDYKEQSRAYDDLTLNELPTLLQKLVQHEENKDPMRILVIGDSLAVGIGCVEEFDPLKDNSWPLALVQNVKPQSMQDEKLNVTQPPVFPQILARTLSSRFNQPVHWRSGGVDGGDINDIKKFCMGIIREECAAVDKGSYASNGPSYTSGPPDIIVVLFGMNDLKNLVSLNIIPQIFRRGEAEDGGGGIAHHFRRGMEALISDIRSYAPHSYIVFPQLPIQTFHKNSIVNILPLGVFVDTMVGFWEGQKRRVMEGKMRKKNTINERNTLYIGLDANEIADWYRYRKEDDTSASSFDDIKEDILISTDGVHPNKIMYARWGESVGEKLYQRIKPHLLDLLEQKQRPPAARDSRVVDRLKQC